MYCGRPPVHFVTIINPHTCTSPMVYERRMFCFQFLQPVYAVLLEKGVQQAMRLASTSGTQGTSGKKKTE